MYDYIFSGKLEVNVALKEGDVINVPAYSSLVSIDGFIKRPMFYEIKDGESLSNLVAYAGGFSGGAWQEWKPVQMQMNYDAAYLLCGAVAE